MHLDPPKLKPVNVLKSPKESQFVKRIDVGKAKTEIDQGKNQCGSAVKKDLEVKKEPETSVKRPSESSVKVVKAKTEEETVKIVRKEPQFINKENVIGKVKTMKKELTIPIASPKSTPTKKKASKDEAEKSEKKVYNLPGQKHEPPDERDPLRIFYESLYQQNPKSEMAEVWMMEHGLLALDTAKRAFERKKKNHLSQKMGSPSKSAKDVVVKSEKTSFKHVSVKSENKKSNSNGSNSFSKAKRKLDSDDDDDFILKPKKKLKTNAY